MLRWLAVMALLCSNALAGEPGGGVSASATVSVGITVASFARIEMPEGSQLLFTVPESCPQPPAGPPGKQRGFENAACHKPWLLGPELHSVRLPFTVSGNTKVQVSIVPDHFLRIKTNRYLGRALSAKGQQIGYHAVVQFPVPAPDYRWSRDWLDTPAWWNGRGWAGFGDLPHWSGIAHMPGKVASGTPPLPADLAARDNMAFGVIYAVSRRDWTADGRDAEPGTYAGTVTIIVIAE